MYHFSAFEPSTFVRLIEEHGIGARSAVGMGSLPGDIPVEIEASFELA